MTATTTERGRWYPSPAPGFDGEDADAYTNRLTGADGTGREPYDHPRNRQCSIGWHSECSDPAGRSCKCPCHADAMTDREASALSPAVRAAGQKLAQLYDLPEITGYKVMSIAEARYGPAALDAGWRGAIAVDIASAYKSRAGNVFLDDVMSVYRAVLAGKLS